MPVPVSNSDQRPVGSGVGSVAGSAAFVSCSGYESDNLKPNSLTRGRATVGFRQAAGTSYLSQGMGGRSRGTLGRGFA